MTEPADDRGRPGDDSAEAPDDDVLPHDVEELVEELVVGPDHRLHAASLIVPVVIVVVGIFLLVHHEDVRQHLLDLRGWSESQGALGWVVFGLVYALGVVLFVPGNLMTGVSLVIFGPYVTVPLVSIAGTTGATAAFLISRYCVRDHVAARLSQNRRFIWLEEHTRTRGALFVAVARSFPVMPGNLLHYAFGITRVQFATYVFWSWLASLPGLVVFVTGLTTVFQLATGGTVPRGFIAAFAGIIVIKIALLGWAARQAGVPLRWRRRTPPSTTED